MLTSDMIISISEGMDFDHEGNITIKRMYIHTMDGAIFKVDKARFGHLKVGDQINISIEVVRNE
jgi:hypothetical protein